jgi:Bacterial Ig-like domain (group 2)
MRVLYKFPEFRKLHDQMENRHRPDLHHGKFNPNCASLGGLDQVRDRKRAEEDIMQCPRRIGRARLLPEVSHPKAFALAIAAVMGFWGCGGGSDPPRSSTPTPTPSPSISVTVTPNSITLSPGTTQSFTATVTGTTNTAVTWSVQESVGGTIDSTGLYTAPQNSSGTFHVVATSQANSAAKGMAAVTIQSSQLTISLDSIPRRML